MIQFPQELLNAKWDTLSPEIREILLSETFDSTIETIISTLGFSEFADKIIDLCTYAVYGLIDQNGFFKELTGLIGVQKSPDLAKELIIRVIIPTVTIKHETKTEIKIEPPKEPTPIIDHPMPVVQESAPVIATAPVITESSTPIPAPIPAPAPVISDIPSQIPAPVIASAPDPVPAPAPIVSAPETITPKFEEEAAKVEPEPAPTAASPFIIHIEKENVESVSETRRNLNTSPVRPVFYEEKESEEDTAPKGAFAKLQFSAPTTNQKIGDRMKETKDISLKDLPVQ